MMRGQIFLIYELDCILFDHHDGLDHISKTLQFMLFHNGKEVLIIKFLLKPLLFMDFNSMKTIIS